MKDMYDFTTSMLRFRTEERLDIQADYHAKLCNLRDNIMLDVSCIMVGLEANLYKAPQVASSGGLRQYVRQCIGKKCHMCWIMIIFDNLHMYFVALQS